VVAKIAGSKSKLLALTLNPVSSKTTSEGKGRIMLSSAIRKAAPSSPMSSTMEVAKSIMIIPVQNRALVAAHISACPTS
jgi:hypothetical protein